MPKLKRSTTSKHTYNGEPVFIYHDRQDGTVQVSYTQDWANEFDVNVSELKPLGKQRTEINRVSDNKKTDDKIYATLRKVFLENKQICELQLDGCIQKATEVHHLFSGCSRSKYYLVVKEWKASCRNCHHIVHNVWSMEQAIKMGLKKIDKKPNMYDLQETDLKNIAEKGISNNL